MKFNPNCSHTTKDGSPCGRKVTDGSQPPVCHVHARRTGTSAVPGPLDPVAKLRRIGGNDRHPQQLQALKVLLDRESACPQCAARAEATAARAQFIARTTPEQRARLRVLFAEIDAIKATAIAQPTQPEPELPPLVLRTPYKEQTEHGQSVLERQEPTGPRTAVSRSTAESSGPAVVHERHPDRAEEVTRLDKSLWASVGIFESNGVPTHALGDDHAQDIITGKIPFNSARAQHEANEARARKIGGPDSTRRIL